MKKILLLGTILTIGLAIGCTSNSPEDAAKDYLNKQLGFNKNIKMKTNALTYTISQKTDATATVDVKGAIRCNGQLNLVKKDGQWQIAP